MSYPKQEDYEVLYARYFNRHPDELFAFTPGLRGKRVLDLCGGGGRASFAAIKQGAERVLLVDKETDMMVPQQMLENTRIEWHCGDIAKMDTFGQHDVIICQQGINYWFNEKTIYLLWKSLSKDGVFVFNTFNQKPSKKPMVKEYDLDNRHYVEISWLTDDYPFDVQHVQICSGYAPHKTSFMWISADKFHSVLNPWFKVTGAVRKNTTIYQCVKRNEKLYY